MQSLCNCAQHVYNICGSDINNAGRELKHASARHGGRASEVWLEVSLTVSEPYAFSLALSSHSLPVCP